MARIQIDDDWLTDPRRFKLSALLGSDIIADGTMVAAWVCAQNFWRNGKKPIPRAVFDRLKNSKEIIETGLAKQIGASIYIRGSRRLFEWLIKAQDDGKAGGLAKARNQKIRSLGLAKGSPRVGLATSTRTNTSINTNTIAQQVERLYQEIYPRKIGKTPGLKKLARVKAEELPLLEKAMRNYLFHSKTLDPKFIMHFSTFTGQWQDWVNWKPEGISMAQPRFNQSACFKEEE